MPIKALICDLDGTFIDSEPLRYKAAQLFLAKWNKSLPQQIYEDVAGLPGREKISWLLGHYGIKFQSYELDEYVGDLERFYHHVGERDLKAFDGASELLESVKPTLQVALATAASKTNTDWALRITGGKNLFNPILCAAHVEKKKPDPQIYLKAASIMGVDPREAAGVEDSTFGIWAIKRAGMYCIGVQTTIPNPEYYGADLVVPTMGHLTLEMILKLGEKNG